ncbi:fimbrial protein [Pseudescherichia sp.]|uniref:fimbrial protein n=1 Tax=Pseudescherichia sp. TaxID=2055881 RepID=UPI00289AF549|nr:fimbrial protein [Pseudescherichia sp.]
MRILLALITVFAVFQAQAYCYISGSNTTPTKKIAPIVINLDVADRDIVNPLDLSGMPDFMCYVISNEFNLSTSEGKNEYYYSIKNNAHNLVLAISLEAVKTTTGSLTEGSWSLVNNYSASALNDKLSYKLKYSIRVNHTGSTLATIDVGEPVVLANKLIIKPTPCIDNLCNNKNPNKDHKYIYEIPFSVKFTPTTCTFKDQDISAQDISYHEIDSNGSAAPKGEQPQLRCSSITGVATSNIHYHFESINMAQSTILKNDLETQQGGAGEVGFQLIKNGKPINFPISEKFALASRGSTLQNNSTYPLDIQLRYARYGNKVFAGRVQSKVKVVVDYD